MAVPLSTVLAGAAVVAAVPLEPAGWFSSKEHPKTALAVAERGAIPYTIDVSPDGVALRCQTPGTADLDRKVCELVMKRARFQPASDDQGRPAFGVHEGVASFLLPGKNSRRPDRAKRTVTVDGLPQGIASPAYAKVAFLVGGDGEISHCASTAAEKRRSFQTYEALGPTACESLARDYRPQVARNAAGDPVASVQSVMIRFEVRPAT